MRAPYRVIVWGPGVIGNALLREITAKPELELVAVRGYSPEKVGKDVGHYLGIEPLGVQITDDDDEIMGANADCVLFCPSINMKLEPGTEGLGLVCRLLESGKNVITSVGLWYPRYHSQALEDRVEAACQKGGACFHATGVHPNLIYERIITTLTGASTRIKYIKMQEISDNRELDSVDMMRALGYGQELSETPWIQNIGDDGYSECLAQTCALLGVKLERVEMQKTYFVARKDIEIATMTVPKGTKAGLDYLYHAIVNGRRFLTIEEILYIDPEDLPEELADAPADCYTITIEGEPTSVKCRMELLASAEQNLRFRKGDTVIPGYYATLVPMIQTIPIVCGAKPGIVYPHTFVNYVPDLRQTRSPLIVR